VPVPLLPGRLESGFAEEFGNEQFDAISIIEVIEHLENPRHVFRQIKRLLKPGGIVVLTTPNASGLYSRLRFFFTGQMAMFTDASYAIGSGHITPLTVWQLEKVFSENEFRVSERRFHDAPFFPPTSLADLAKIVAWSVFRVFMLGTVGGQNVMYIVESEGSPRG
jgi:SAM-dependent methyltransferase